MKMKINSGIALVIGTGLILTSCNDEIENRVDLGNDKVISEEMQGEFKKSFVIYDESGQNSMSVTLTSDNKDLLDKEVTSNYELLINPKDEIIEETSDSNDDFEDDVALTDISPGSGINIYINSVNMAENVSYYELSMSSDDSSNSRTQGSKKLRHIYLYPSGSHSYWWVKNTNLLWGKVDVWEQLTLNNGTTVDGVSKTLKRKQSVDAERCYLNGAPDGVAVIFLTINGNNISARWYKTCD